MADVPFIDLNPYLLGIQATLLLLQQLGLIPDLNPLDYIISAFDGKPKLEDTEQAALRLQSSPWWPLRALGNNLQIWVRNGVPLSTGIAADRLELSQWIQGTINSIEPIVFNRFDPFSLDHAIWLAMTSQFGDQAIVQLNNEIANQAAKGPLPTPPPPPPGPPTPPGPPPGGGVVSNRDTDEELDIGTAILAELSTIRGTVTNPPPPPNTDQCCANIVTAIGNIASELNALVGSATATGELAGIASAIASITGAINSLAPLIQQLVAAGGEPAEPLPPPAIDLTFILEAIEGIGNTLKIFEQCVCDAMTKGQTAADASEVKAKAAIQYWSSLGIGDPNATQIALS